jgi:hypothetical protein
MTAVLSSSILLVALGMACFGPIAFHIPERSDQANPETFRAVSGGINISANLNPASIEGSMYVFDLAISHEKDRFASTTVISQVNTKEQAIEVLKNSFGWKGDYFFIRLECGGGNAWRCDREQVFVAIGGRLSRVGETVSGGRDSKLGEFYQDGYFIDIYDKFETNNLTSHVGAPGIWIYSKFIDRHLQVDLEQTWLKNRQRSTEKLDLGKIPKSNSDADIKSALIWNGVLAKYCRHEADLLSVISLAKAQLDAKSSNLFLQILDRVVPGELPQSR